MASIQVAYDRTIKLGNFRKIVNSIFPEENFDFTRIRDSLLFNVYYYAQEQDYNSVSRELLKSSIEANIIVKSLWFEQDYIKSLVKESSVEEALESLLLIVSIY